MTEGLQPADDAADVAYITERLASGEQPVSIDEVVAVFERSHGPLEGWPSAESSPQ